MAQRYTSQVALDRMLDNLCPECGRHAEIHSYHREFQLQMGCDLLPNGVWDRTAQFWADIEAVSS